VLHLDARLFYAHRGLEKQVEGRPFDAALPIVERACGVCTVAHALAYAMAVEALTHTAIPPRAAWDRAILAELERLYNHVGDLANICAWIGFQSGVARLGVLKERLLRLNESVSGHRYLMGVVGPGGLRSELDAGGLEAMAAALGPLDHDLAGAVRSVIRSEGVMARLRGTGLVATTLAASRPASRRARHRATSARPAVRRQRARGRKAEASTGDVAARFTCGPGGAPVDRCWHSTGSPRIRAGLRSRHHPAVGWRFAEGSRARRDLLRAV
jgi:Ni,Fe-hydrogenase III large subunit